MTAPRPTPRVAAEARRCGVDVTALTGTGVGGRVSLKDVHAAADSAGTRPRPLAALAASRGPQYARNPLVDEALRATPQVAIRAAGERPTLFHSGDLPPFTASGIDPAALLNVPWQARHAVAAASSTGQAYQLLEMYADDPEGASIEFGASGSNAEYERRVQDWVRSGLTEDELYAQVFGETEGRARQDALALGRDPRRFNDDAVARRRR